MTPLYDVICQEIENSNGQITFAKFMDLANSEPNFGYYSQQNLQWGPSGDYETSPEIHPMYGYLWAKQIFQCWHELDRPKKFSLIEIGGGSGVIRDVPDNTKVMGYPAKNIREFLRDNK